MWLLVLSSMFLAFAANASVTVTTKIHDIDYGTGNERTFLLLDSGHVAWIKKSEKKSLAASFASALQTKKEMTFVLNEHNELVSAKLIPASTKAFKRRQEARAFTFNELYVPTKVEGLELAKTYFHEAREVHRSSQCYNRAHVWSYEWYKNHGILSNKTWIFFTRRYIRKQNYKWWFHVAPSMAVRDAEVVKEKVMDLEFSSKPLDVKQWTSIFMRDGATCPKVEKYSDYSRYPESGSCFTMRSSMFYHQPFDLESKETWNVVKTNWYEADLKQAYLETFGEEF